MYLYKTYYLAYPGKIRNKVRDDFLRLNKDLQILFSFRATVNNILSGYDFASLFDQFALQAGFLSELKKVDLCVVVTLASEFDASHTHIGAYMLDRYRLCCEILDLADVSVLPISNAFYLVRKYLHAGMAKTACILSFSQKGVLVTAVDMNVSCDNSISALFFRV